MSETATETLHPADIFARMRKGTPQREAVHERIGTLLKVGMSDEQIADELTSGVADGLGLPAGPEVHEVIRQLASGQRKGR